MLSGLAFDGAEDQRFPACAAVRDYGRSMYKEEVHKPLRRLTRYREVLTVSGGKAVLTAVGCAGL